MIGETEVVCPSDMLAIGDAVISRDLSPLLWLGVWNTQPVSDSTTPCLRGNPQALSAMGKRHGGRWNLVFCDGHVENLTLKALFDAYDDFVLKRWNRDHLPHREVISSFPH